MVKFYKPGKVVVVLNGRHAGKKGIIIKSNYENVKDKKFPHCLIVGMSKGPRKATKRSLKKLDEKIKKLEAIPEKDRSTVADQLNRLRKLGVFIKTYNMTHLLVTRYSVREGDFGISKSLEQLERIETNIKEKQAILNKKEQERKEENVKDIEALKKEIGEARDSYKQTFRKVKLEIGGEMYNRFMKGFVRPKDNPEESEKVEHTEFLFKKLKF